VAFYDCSQPFDREVGLQAAERAVRNSDLVVLPTDTVYGIGCDAFSSVAVGELLAAKGRGRDMPVPVLIGSWATLDGLVDRVPEAARELQRAFWPGGLTLVVRHSRSLAWDLGDAAGTVAVRMPLHPVAIELLQRVGPMAVSSANRTGLPPASDAQQALAQLGDAVAVYLDGGPVGEAVPSSIVDVASDGPPRLLRAGAVGVDALREVVPDLVVPAAG
jgi:tRNA threonylcarbamoyl adenosine modification protein (Sua5/YciO/YrdC/YwlC family)